MTTYTEAGVLSPNASLSMQTLRIKLAPPSHNHRAPCPMEASAPARTNLGGTQMQCEEGLSYSTE